MGRDYSDLRLHFDEVPSGYGIVPINSSRTLAIHTWTRTKEGWLEAGWAFVGEGAGSIPSGFGPLPRASSAVRGNLFVGGFPTLD
jgi:hypothetical protein